MGIDWFSDKSLFFFILRRMGKDKALAHRTSTYFRLCFFLLGCIWLLVVSLFHYLLVCLLVLFVLFVCLYCFFFVL